jgi:hypothetical protein
MTIGGLAHPQLSCGLLLPLGGEGWDEGARGELNRFLLGIGMTSPFQNPAFPARRYIGRRSLEKTPRTPQSFAARFALSGISGIP